VGELIAIVVVTLVVGGVPVIFDGVGGVIVIETGSPGRFLDLLR
jgi:hypothetical protein